MPFHLVPDCVTVSVEVSAFRDLICGNTSAVAQAQASNLFIQCVNHIGSTLDFFIEEIGKFRDQPEQRVALFGPFVGRSVLELASTVLVGRLDPFRILTLYKSQTQADYELSSRRKMAFNWRGDVISSDKPPQDTWKDQAFSQLPRALIGAYYAEVFWSPAFEKMIDDGILTGSSPWELELLNTDPSSFAARQMKLLDSTYSSLSKGVHHEFVVRVSAMYDLATVTDLVRDAIKAASNLALVACYIEHASSHVDPAEALTLFHTIESQEAPQ